MTTADSHIGSNRQHRLSDQVPANTHNTRARRKGARDSGPSAAASTSPPAPGVSGEHLILYGSGLAGLGGPRVRIHLPPADSLVSRRNSPVTVEKPRFSASVAGRSSQRGRQRRARRGDMAPTGDNISVGSGSGTASPVMLVAVAIPWVL